MGWKNQIRYQQRISWLAMGLFDWAFAMAFSAYKP
jgi:hypothetical protein